jgi:hypothetical protein
MNEILLGVEKQKVKQMLEHPATFATVLHAIGLKYFDVEYYQWDPETIAMEFEEEFGAKLPPENINKILAIAYLQLTDLFYRDWATFHAITGALNNDDRPLQNTDIAIPAEIAWAVTEAHLNDPGYKPPSTPVRKYVGHVLSEAGISEPPPLLSWAIMPEVYRGSMYPGDLNQEQQVSQERTAQIKDYLQSQSLLLFQQISQLPWMTDEQLDEVHSNIGL